MLARCLQDVWKLSSMSLNDLLIFFVSVWVGIWRVAVKSVRCVESVYRVSGRCLKGVWSRS